MLPPARTSQGMEAGKDIKLQDDGSIMTDQAFYVADKVKVIKLARARLSVQSFRSGAA